MAETAIRLRNVHLTLGSGRSTVHVLKGVDLAVDRGESVGIVGPSGSGKSTLLMVLAGLERADEGLVEIAGTPLRPMSEDQLAAFRGRNVGIVFQSFHLIPNMTALENVAVPLELAGMPDAFARAERELGNVGLKDRATHYPGELSGGEQQRVAMARALAPEPAILIADEPTGNLDQETGRQVADLLFAEQQRRQMTLVLVTHDPTLAERCGRTIAVRAGVIHDDGARRSASVQSPAGERGADGAARLVEPITQAAR
ncbi:ABC transporter ATP-binding protein [Jiella sp. MQZ9-1]|uniref:ABC transporter ATP-binding protein n=1 Tax=Jiella flava TaxID=2816857 RepID=A0A939JV20_9HYPH|nr:ABC transporter ATP-binding protein [Jiella flava]MBO0661552.1 ABC transporter ATP-binding protein [Jiella flava]MCD2470194.1 ABC transporter ATP-binding protein [Jiella flava]